MKYQKNSWRNSKVDNTLNISDLCELIEVISPKSGFDPEIKLLTDRSTIIQVPPNLYFILLPSLAIIISLF